MEPFYMVVAVKPKSMQNDHLRGYKAYLREKAAEAWAGRTTMVGPLYARVLWMHAYEYRPGAGDPDTDNMVKPVLDALEGVVYGNDWSILRVTSTRWDAARGGDLGDQPNMPHWLYGRLSSMLAKPGSDTLYVEVGTTAPEPVVFGSVDGVIGDGNAG